MLASVFAILLFAAASPCFGINCPQLGTNLRVTKEPQMLYSPGYPDFYKNSQDCLWYFTGEKQSSDLAIQIVTLQMDVNDDQGNCNSDYLEAIAGTDENSGASIARWCGQEKRIVKYRGSHMVLKFHTDEQFIASGFVLTYNLVKLSSATCRQDVPRSIIIEEAPLYEVFKGAPSVSPCQWHISAANRNFKLVVELFKPSETMSSSSKMIIYEGSEATGDINYQWSPTLNMFSKMYLSTFDATLVLTGDGVGDDNEDGVILKLSVMDPFSYASDCSHQNKATLEFHGAPIMFALPFTSDRRSGQPCALLLRNSDGMNIRLDATGVKDAILTCENTPVNVINSNQTAVTQSCYRGKTPVYFSDDSSMTLTLPYQRTMYLMATAMDNKCNGLIQKVTAYADVIQTEWFSKDGDYMNFAKCRILVVANKRGDAVKAKVTWKIPAAQSTSLYSDSNVCDGDFLNIYNGNSESSRLLYSSCHQSDRPHRLVEAHVASTRRNLFIEFDADKMFVAHSLKVEYHSFPASANCIQPIEISVDKEHQTVSSPNYPGAYPLHQKCDYILRSYDPRPDEDIVIKVIDAKLPATCQDILTIYKGEKFDSQDIVDRICGNDDRKVIRVEKALASMRFISDKGEAHEGWSVEIYLEKRDSSGGIKKEWNPMLVILTFICAYFSLF